MARDYAKSPSRKKSTRKRKPAPARNGGVPGWLWMLAGLLVGLFVAGLVYLNLAVAPRDGAPVAERPAPKPEPQRSAPRTDTRAVKKPEPKPAPKPEKPAKKEDKGLSYDFYTILPEYEVPVPEEEPKPGVKPPEARDLEPGKYVLQVGSFSTAKDADGLKAQLTLQGFEPKIQTVTVDGEKTWHRVRIGPYQDTERLREVETRLHEQGIEYMLLKEKGD